MNNLARIKVIRQSERAMVAVDTEKDDTSSSRRNEREIAARVGGWIRDLREHRRTEDAANLRRFFGEPVPMSI